LWLAESCPDHALVEQVDKVVSCRVRLTVRLNWDARVARLFAADMGESVLLGERAFGREPDDRAWAAVDVARRYANGDATRGELAAAGAAVRDARAAARAAEAAAWAAARAAAWGAWAAWGAGAAWAAEDAAWAAGDAAWAASWAAGDDAGAAEDAAWAASYKRLCLYLTDSPLPPVTALYGT